jgi:hypothetical protein
LTCWASAVSNLAFVATWLSAVPTTTLYCLLSGVFGDDATVILIALLLIDVPYGNDHQLSIEKIENMKKCEKKILFIFNKVCHSHIDISNSMHQCIRQQREREGEKKNAFR